MLMSVLCRASHRPGDVVGAGGYGVVLCIFTRSLYTVVCARGERRQCALQAYRNTVPVPRHWSQKRKYLQGKRGLEKPAFRLPEFIEATGISEMRQAYQEKVCARAPAPCSFCMRRSRSLLLSMCYGVVRFICICYAADI